MCAGKVKDVLQTQRGKTFYQNPFSSETGLESERQTGQQRLFVGSFFSLSLSLPLSAPCSPMPPSPPPPSHLFLSDWCMSCPAPGAAATRTPSLGSVPAGKEAIRSLEKHFWQWQKPKWSKWTDFWEERSIFRPLGRVYVFKIGI